jgi:hypothetical protein
MRLEISDVGDEMVIPWGRQSVSQVPAFLPPRNPALIELILRYLPNT